MGQIVEFVLCFPISWFNVTGSLLQTISRALATAMEHLTKISSQVVINFELGYPSFINIAKNDWDSDFEFIFYFQCMMRQFEVIQAQYLDFKLGSFADEWKIWRLDATVSWKLDMNITFSFSCCVL